MLSSKQCEVSYLWGWLLFRTSVVPLNVSKQRNCVFFCDFTDFTIIHSSVLLCLPIILQTSAAWNKETPHDTLSQHWAEAKLPMITAAENRKRLAPVITDWHTETQQWLNTQQFNWSPNWERLLYHTGCPEAETKQKKMRTRPFSGNKLMKTNTPKN